MSTEEHEAKDIHSVTSHEHTHHSTSQLNHNEHRTHQHPQYGANINSTPNIDRLAHTGMRFNSCYVTNSICTPSRAAILTGTHNHVNNVLTLSSTLPTHLPNLAKTLRASGLYQTAMIGKWHLGEGPAHQPSGFDAWSVLPGQGDYWDPTFISNTGPNGSVTEEVEDGYVTDIITAKTKSFIANRDKSKSFFLMCHHKAPHRSWESHPRYRGLYTDKIRVPETYTDDYKHRARAAKRAKMRVAEDMTYFDLGLAQPDGGRAAVGERIFSAMGFSQRKIPTPNTPADLANFKLVDVEDGTVFRFNTAEELAEFKYQRYMQRYLRTIQAVDDSVGSVLDFLEEEGLSEDTVVVYTSDQGFFLGEHGWFDKRFMYEESFQMPFLVRAPRAILPAPGGVCDDIICNVDFAPFFLDVAGVTVPSYMQGVSFKKLLEGRGAPPDWQQVAYHRYWMNNDWTHAATAHYGVRDRRWKLIYWYNQALGVPGAAEPEEGEEGGEWELFDCEMDPLELFNLWGEVGYEEVVGRMTRLLERKMAEIGDDPVHVSGSLGESFDALRT